MKIYQLPGNIRAEKLSAALYTATHPGEYHEGHYLFSWESKEGLPDAIIIDEDEVPLFQDEFLDEVIISLATELNGDITPEEGQAFADKLRSENKIRLTDIIPSSFVEITLDDLYTLGYRIRKSPIE